MAEASNKPVTLLSVFGNDKAKLEQYKNTVQKVMGDDDNFGRYWMMYAKIAQEQLCSPYVTNKQSVVNCLFNAPKFRLNPDPVFGEIYFIPYKGVLTYQIGYKGMIKLAQNTGKVKNVRAGIVYEKDQWDFWEDENGQHYKFKPSLQLSDRGKELFVYSIFTDENGKPNVHIMEKSHVDAIKALVKQRMNGKKTPWDDPLFEPEMRKKTCVRRHWKYEPKSAEVAKAIDYEEKIERGETFKDLHPELTEIVIPVDIDETESITDLIPELMTDEEKAKYNKQKDLK
jgi:recombination protein RecT